MDSLDTLGVVESRSIAEGVEIADCMVKAAAVELIRAATVCGGRYLIYVAGDRAAVSTSVKCAQDSGRALVGCFVISNIAAQVLDVLKKSSGQAARGEALGVIEARTVSSGIRAADSAVKRALIRLLRLATGQGINGKSYFVISGDVAAVEEAADASRSALGKDLVAAVVIPSPSVSVVEALTSAKRLI